MDPRWIEEIGLGLTLWEGEYLGIRQTWLRWCDRNGKVLPTGQESAAARPQTIDKLREHLRALGVEPAI